MGVLSTDSQHTAVQSGPSRATEEREREIEQRHGARVRPRDHHKAAGCHGSQPSSAPCRHQPLHSYLMRDSQPVAGCSDMNIKIEFISPKTSIKLKNFLKHFY